MHSPDSGQVVGKKLKLRGPVKGMDEWKTARVTLHGPGRISGLRASLRLATLRSSETRQGFDNRTICMKG